MSEKGLGEEKNEGLAELTMYLSSENVEQICGGGHVGNLHVAILVLSVELVLCREDARVLVTELKVSLNSAGRVLRTLSVVSVRK